RRVELSPCQEAIGRVKRYEATSVCPDYRLRVVSEELVEVVEIASGLRSHVGDIQCLPVYLVAAGDLKLTIKISSAAGQRQQASAPPSFPDLPPTKNRFWLVEPPRKPTVSPPPGGKLQHSPPRCAVF